MGFLHKSELREAKKMVKEKSWKGYIEETLTEGQFILVKDVMKILEKFSYLPIKKFFKKCGYKIPKDAWK